MSRIGRQPVPVPAGVEIKIDGNRLWLKGPKGQLERELHRDMIVKYEEGHLLIERPSDNKQHRSLHGLTRTLVNNMVVGVTAGFQKNLELVGVGYRASLQGKKLVMSMGYSHPVEIEPEEGLVVEVPTPTRISVLGISKERVGALAAVIRAVREPEPYKGKGVRYEGEVVRRKAGKAGAKGKK
ncbi:MAG: 50S ribosomal protein L6 [Peptococcaceae bacterium]|nr:50S ribosomal protein L6 [Peptococcaceae bacterium]